MATRVKVHFVSNNIERGWTANVTVYQDVESTPSPMGDFTETTIPIVGAMTWENISQQAYDFAVKAVASKASTLTENFGVLYP